MTSRAQQSQTLSELNKHIDGIWTTKIVTDFQQLVVCKDGDDFTPPDNLLDKVKFIVWGFGHLFVNLVKVSSELHDQTGEIADLKEELKVTREVEINGLCGYKTQIAELKEEIDIEHQRYLSVQEKYSNSLWEVCQELDIENNDKSENIIKEITKLKEEIAQLKEN